jgi:hypothetical protein
MSRLARTRGDVITATATDPAGNTSEFSPCAAVPVDNIRPTCQRDPSSNSSKVILRIEDNESGLKQINISGQENVVMTQDPNPFTPGTTDPVTVTYRGTSHVSIRNHL